MIDLHVPAILRRPGQSDCWVALPVDAVAGRRLTTVHQAVPAAAVSGDDRGCSAASSTLARPMPAADPDRPWTTTSGRDREAARQCMTGRHTAGPTMTSPDDGDHVFRATVAAAGGRRLARSK